MTEVPLALEHPKDQLLRSPYLIIRHSALNCASWDGILRPRSTSLNIPISPADSGTVSHWCRWPSTLVDDSYLFLLLPLVMWKQRQNSRLLGGTRLKLRPPLATTCLLDRLN